MKVDNEKIFLIGMMGSGKSSIGLKLSRLINISFYDTDDIIGVPKFFNNNNLQDFRDRELNTISTISSLFQKCIISTGGGSVLNKQTRDIMRRYYCIYLKTSINVLIERIINHKICRPIINYDVNGQINKNHFTNLYKSRAIHYNELSNFTIITDNLSEEEIVDKINNAILKNAI